MYTAPQFVREHKKASEEEILTWMLLNHAAIAQLSVCKNARQGQPCLALRQIMILQVEALLVGAFRSVRHGACAYCITDYDDLFKCIGQFVHIALVRAVAQSHDYDFRR